MNHQELTIEGTTVEELFGDEKNESFKGSIAAIYQTFGGFHLYPGVEEIVDGGNLPVCCNYFASILNG